MSGIGLENGHEGISAYMRTKSTLVQLGKGACKGVFSKLYYIDDKFGLPTVTDIISELDKPGRDPRPEFKTAEFKAGVEKISDLKPGMILEGRAR